MMTKEKLKEIRDLVTAATPNGPWTASYESCGCDYCTHGRWISAIYGPTNESYADYPANSDVKIRYGKQVTEISEFTHEAALLVTDAPKIIKDLLAEVERQRARSKFFERAAARASREINRMADEHEQCEVTQEADDAAHE